MYNVKGNSQCNPQVRWLEGIRADFVGKIENIGVDMYFLGKKPDICTDNLPLKNVTKRKAFPDYYDELTIDLVRFFYEEDFKAFGYSLDLDI